MDYKGFREYHFKTDEEMAHFYENITDNIFNVKINEYILLYSPDDVLVDKLKWNGEIFIQISFKPINNDWFSKVKPLNTEQELAFDMLQDKNTTVKLITGKMGSGKTFLTTCHIVQALKQNKYDRIVFMRNPTNVRDVSEIGYLPGSELDKLISFAMPLADSLGGKDGLLGLITQGKIVVESLGSVRGRDYKNTAIFLSEAENLTSGLVQLLIGRVGNGSTLFLDGDVLQTDKKIFDTNSGLRKAVDVLSGNKLFGYVELQKCERSETAALADLFN